MHCSCSVDLLLTRLEIYFVTRSERVPTDGFARYRYVSISAYGQRDRAALAYPAPVLAVE